MKWEAIMSLVKAKAKQCSKSELKLLIWYTQTLENAATELYAKKLDQLVDHLKGMLK